MPSYQEHLNGLREKALRQVNDGLNAEDETTRFMYSLMFLNYFQPEELEDLQAPKNLDDENWDDFIEQKEN